MIQSKTLFSEVTVFRMVPSGCLYSLLGFVTGLIGLGTGSWLTAPPSCPGHDLYWQATSHTHQTLFQELWTKDREKELLSPRWQQRESRERGSSWVHWSGESPKREKDMPVAEREANSAALREPCRVQKDGVCGVGTAQKPPGWGKKQVRKHGCPPPTRPSVLAQGRSHAED